MTSKEKVLRVYPKALIIESLMGGKFVSLGQHDGKELAYRRDGDEALLWDAAASKLSSPAGETPAHKWNKDGERCEVCGDKDWMGGPCRVPVPTGGAADGMSVEQLREAADKQDVICECGHARGDHWHRAQGVMECGKTAQCGCLLFQAVELASAPEAAAAGEGLAGQVASRIVGKFPQIEQAVLAPLLKREIWIAFTAFSDEYERKLAAPIAPAAVSRGTEFHIDREHLRQQAWNAMLCNAAPVAAVSGTEKHQCPYCGWSSPCPVSSQTASAEPMVTALRALKLRIHFIGWPNEPRDAEGRPDWSKEIALLETALTGTASAEGDGRLYDAFLTGEVLHHENRLSVTNGLIGLYWHDDSGAAHRLGKFITPEQEAVFRERMEKGWKPRKLAEGDGWIAVTENYAVEYLLKGETKWRRTMYLPLLMLPDQEKVLWENPWMAATRMVALQARLLTPDEIALLPAPPVNEETK